MAYFTADELQNRMGGGDFTSDSFPTTTMVTDMSVELSAMWDGLAQQTEGTETPAEYVKQACMATAVYQIGQMRKNEPIDPEKQIRIMKQFMTGAANERMSYSQQYPKISGTW